LLKPLGRITADAVTGPAMLPLPASSIPTSNSDFENLFFNINCKIYLVKKSYLSVKIQN
jgi:hypothetical protein